MISLQNRLFLGLISVAAWVVAGCGGGSGSTTPPVVKTTPTITWAAPTAITYGTALSATQLDATASVAGTFSYSPASGTVLAAGAQTLSVTFTPTDTTNYNSATGSTTLTVNKAALAVTVANQTMTYGSALPSLTGSLTGVVSGDGITATYATTATATSPVASYPITATLVDPNSKLANYTVTNTPGALTVAQATPTVSWTAPSAITYGTALSGTQLDASLSAAGVCVYSPASGVVLTAGSQTLKATCTPTDSVDYATPTQSSVSLTVNKAALAVTANNQTMAVGGTLPTLTGTLTGVVNSDAITATYATTATASSPAGTYPITATLVDPSTRLPNYTVTNTPGTLKISATPAVTAWPTAAALTYGQALSASTLTGGTASVAGAFAWTTPTTVPKVGGPAQSVTFTPTDTADYAPMNGTVSVTVTPATPTITWNAPAAITAGAALSSTQLSATAASSGSTVAGTFAYTSTSCSLTNPVQAGTTLVAGVYTLGTTFTPSDTSDYNAATASVTLTVNAAANSAVADLCSTSQTIRGFGGSEAWDGSVMSTPKINNLYGTTGTELGLSMIRVRIAPLSTWNTTTLTGSTSQWNTELENAVEAVNAGSNVTVFATPWSAPASMKTNSSVNEGSLISTGTTYSDYANYLEAYARYAATQNVNLYAISMQNEPDWNPCPASDNGTGTGSGCYESALWTAAQMHTWVANNASVLTVPLIMPESFYFANAMSDPTLNDASAAAKVAIVGGHLYGSSPYYYTLAKNLGKDVWMTEHTIYLAAGETTTQSMTDALALAEEIHNSMVTGQYNAYVYWWMENSVGNGYYEGFVDTTNSANPTLMGYAMGQFSRFIRPGYVRLNATATPVSGVYLSAYSGSGGHVTIVAINSTSASVSLPISIANNNGTVTLLTPYQTTASAGLVAGSTITVTNSAFTASLPAKSITTFVQ
jgi:glucuronoarabinoxylan endo-1,4-beta-xylanase